MARALANMSNVMEKIAIRLERVESGESHGFNEKMESVVHKVTNSNSYFEPIDNTKLKGKPTEEFCTTDIPKFKPTNNPKYHSRNFHSTMIIKSVDP